MNDRETIRPSERAKIHDGLNAVYQRALDIRSDNLLDLSAGLWHLRVEVEKLRDFVDALRGRWGIRPMKGAPE